MAVLTLHNLELLTSAEKLQKLQKLSILFLTVKVTESSCTCITSPAEASAKSFLSKFAGTKTGETFFKMAILGGDAHFFLKSKFQRLTQHSGSF